MDLFFSIKSITLKILLKIVYIIFIVFGSILNKSACLKHYSYLDLIKNFQLRN